MGEILDWFTIDDVRVLSHDDFCNAYIPRFVRIDFSQADLVLPVVSWTVMVSPSVTLRTLPTSVYASASQKQRRTDGPPLSTAISLRKDIGAVGIEPTTPHHLLVALCTELRAS